MVTFTLIVVLCVAFHHRLGPQIEFCYPPFPGTNSSVDSVDLPAEWSFLPFMCLPDGAHSSQEEFIYFHLPPSEILGFDRTIFGLSCFRQIDAKELLTKNADVSLCRKLQFLYSNGYHYKIKSYHNL